MKLMLSNKGTFIPAQIDMTGDGCLVSSYYYPYYPCSRMFDKDFGSYWESYADGAGAWFSVPMPR